MEIEDLEKYQYYRIKGESDYFNKKYGTCNPKFRYEIPDVEAWDKPWHYMSGNPCSMLFQARVEDENLIFNMSDRVCYGHIKLPNDEIFLAELVHPSELEII